MTANISNITVAPAGCQQWNRDVADSSGTRCAPSTHGPFFSPLSHSAARTTRRAAYCSTLAMYVYDIAGTPKLEHILTASDRTILSLAWSPHDPNAIAMAIAEEEANVLVWDLAAEELAKRLSAIAKPAKHIAWCALAKHS